MKMVPLPAEVRAKDTAPKTLRKGGVVPCVLYGNDTENVSIQCEYKTLLQAYKQAGESTLVELTVHGGKKMPVLFHAIDFNPVTGAIIHADFYAVDMKKEIEAKVPVHCLGESPAVKELGGVLVMTLDHVKVRCLPANLPHDLKVDVSGLKEFGDIVTVAGLQTPEGVIIEEEPESVLATVQEPRRIEEEEPAVKVEGVEGAEGLGAEEGEGAKEGEAGAESSEPKEKERGAKQA